MPEAVTQGDDTLATELASHNRRRFTIAVLIGGALAAIPYLYVLWDLWNGTINPARSVGPSNFYDIQADAMLHGTLQVPKGSLGIEAFLHNHHSYTYFGIFPSLIRIPFIVTIHHGGQYTAPAMLTTWVLTGLFSALLLWRVRFLARGDALLGRLEAAAYGVFILSVLAGSVLLYLAIDPWVYHEDLAWGVALTIGSLWALLEVMLRPRWWRVLLAGALILSANLNRLTTGWGCTIAAVMVGVWFLVSASQRENRRWGVWTLLAGLIPLMASSAVNEMKFGLAFGLPMADQVWTHVNAHRRYFLTHNGGKAFSVSFLLTTLPTYFTPFGIRFSSLFPYVWLPAAPALDHGSVVFDQTYASGSIPATMPVLFFPAAWGVLYAFFKNPFGRLNYTRFLILAAGASTVGVLLWGYIANRYMTDFIPLLVIAGSVGVVDGCRRLEGRAPAIRRGAYAAFGLVALYGLVVNIAIAIGPTNTWLPVQSQHFVSTQGTMSPKAQQAVTTVGPTLPYFAPNGHLFVAQKPGTNTCSGLYLSSGITFANSPGQQLQHETWIPVEQGPGIAHQIKFRINVPLKKFVTPVPLVSWGTSTLEMVPTKGHWIKLEIKDPSAPSITWPPASGPWIAARPHQTYGLIVTTDPNLHAMHVAWQGTNFSSLGFTWINHYIAGPGPAIVWATFQLPGKPLPEVTVINAFEPAPDLSLCNGLLAHVHH